ncbi:hypothetical protein SAMN04487820_105114 [Actinopolyspora mzabensis]|uniref:Uncharacterized protein n=1 Tax=Actinopolyspora mzabensis TaxID=995066 RepID=A0A1G8ZUJ4_ACTMZ|nr:hypothetical protein SAMN04487820_105114 [Actinopolyspora mzabensis]
MLGHRYRFRAVDRELRWHCERGCGAGGSKSYDTAERAERYAAALDREDRAALGERAPLIGLLPLRLWRSISRKRQASSSPTPRS